MTSGNIYYENHALSHFPAKAFYQKIATLTQNYTESLFTSLTVYDNYLLYLQRRSCKLIFAKYIAQFNPALAEKSEQKVDHLSGGEKQALALGLRMLNPPQLLLLDEHTSALDPKTAQQVMQLTQKIVTENHLTCILTTHDLDIALHYGNRILALNQGKIMYMIDHENKATVDKATLLAACY
jgi:putative ABC transport system ATP-binding protein